MPVEPAKRLSQLEFPVSAPPAERRGSKPARVAGVVLMIAVVLFWALLIIGIAVDPTDVGYAILGGIILSGLPFAVAVYLLRRGFRS